MKGNPQTDKELVLFVLEQIEVLGEYLQNVEENSFYSNNMLKDATLTRLLVIGEYARRVSDNIKLKYTDVRWVAMIQARNFYAHGYGMIEWMQVWETLSVEIPKMKRQFEKIVNEL